MPIQLISGVPVPADRRAIAALAAKIEDEDGAPPLSDQTMSRFASDGVTQLVMHDAGELIGYAQRDGDSVEIAARADALDALFDAIAAPPAQIWSHGRHSRLIGVLDRRGFRRGRELHQLRRPLDHAHPLPDDPPLADGIVVREFVAGHDDDAWLAVNAAAFANHPEQGRWTAADLRARIDSGWFDAAGFLLAARGGELLGFHWTKIHPAGLGEVYVIGIAPKAQGLGLGQALLVRGLRYLAARGCPTVLLYVDGDNSGALRLYERAGFTSFDHDVQWEL